LGSILCKIKPPSFRIENFWLKNVEKIPVKTAGFSALKRKLRIASCI